MIKCAPRVLWAGGTREGNTLAGSLYYKTLLRSCVYLYKLITLGRALYLLRAWPIQSLDNHVLDVLRQLLY